MKIKILIAAVLSVLLAALPACGKERAPMPPIENSRALASQMGLSSTVTGTNDGVSDFISLQKSFSAGYDADVCCNITPRYILDHSDFRIFKYDRSCASFLLYDHEIYPMGEWFGGFGVTDAKLFDIDGDNVMELYFTFSCGSGIHRSQAGYFNPDVKEIVLFDYVRTNGELMIAANENGGLSLHQASISPMESFVDFTIEAHDYVADIVLEHYSEVRLAVIND